MTLHTVTTYTVSCDGTLATACDPSHPEKPHTCPERLTVDDSYLTPHLRVLAASDLATLLSDARWIIAIPDLRAPARHYCPTHRDQATPEDLT